MKVWVLDVYASSCVALSRWNNLCACFHTPIRVNVLISWQGSRDEFNEIISVLIQSCMVKPESAKHITKILSTKPQRSHNEPLLLDE